MRARARKDFDREGRLWEMAQNGIEFEKKKREDNDKKEFISSLTLMEKNARTVVTFGGK